MNWINVNTELPTTNDDHKFFSERIFVWGSYKNGEPFAQIGNFEYKTGKWWVNNDNKKFVVTHYCMITDPNQ